MRDDGIKFQWGDKYIKADQVTSQGGKYWRDNGDGTITRFSPPELRFKSIVGIVVAYLGGGKKAEKRIIVNKRDYTITFKSESEAVTTFSNLDVIDNEFWGPRGVTFELEAPAIKFTLTDDIKEWTYTSEKGPNN